MPAVSDPGPKDGHQFHFTVTVQGSYQIVGDPQHYDCEPDPEADPFTLTVRAWCLADACRVAAQASFGDWQHSYEEGEPS